MGSTAALLLYAWALRFPGHEDFHELGDRSSLVLANDVGRRGAASLVPHDLAEIVAVVHGHQRTVLIDRIAMILGLRQVHDLAVLAHGSVLCLPQTFVFWCREDVRAAGPKRPDDITKCSTIVEDVLEDILCEDQIERTVRERHAFEILTANPFMDFPLLHTGKQVAGHIMRELPCEPGGDRPARRQLVEVEVPPMRVQSLEHARHRALTRNGTTAFTAIVVPEPRIAGHEPRRRRADRAEPVMFEVEVRRSLQPTQRFVGISFFPLGTGAASASPSQISRRRSTYCSPIARWLNRERM